MYLVIREDSAGLDFVLLTTWNELIHTAVLLWMVTDLFCCCFLKCPSAVLLLSPSLTSESHDPKSCLSPSLYLQSPEPSCLKQEVQLPGDPQELHYHSNLALGKEGPLSERLCFPTWYLKMNYDPACQSITGRFSHCRQTQGKRWSDVNISFSFGSKPWGSLVLLLPVIC